MDEAVIRDHVEARIQLVRLAREAEPRFAETAECLDRISTIEAANPGLPGLELARRLRLSTSELEVLWHLVERSCSLDGDQRGGLERIRRAVYGEAPSLIALRELTATGTLVRLSLVEPRGHETGDDWAISARILTWLLGDSSLPEGELPSLRLGEPVRLDTLAVDEGSVITARSAVRDAARRLVIFAAPPGSGRRLLATAIAFESGVQTLEIDCKRLAKDHAVYRRQLKLLARESLLLGRSPLLRNLDALVDDRDTTRVDLVGSELVAELTGPVFVTCGLQRPALRWDRPTVVIEMKPPTSAQRAQLWARELGQGSADDAEYLATQYPLAPALIHHAAAAAKARAAGRALQPQDIYAGVRAVLDDRLGSFAKRVEVTQTWDDLVLPQEQHDQITYLVARIRQRRTVYEQWGFAAKVGKGLGVSALFSGPPGTGKTMIAALVAAELGLELYQVDMAKIVSKWLGETERNLAELFDAAEAGHAVLLFDEADSLFGKRTDVRSSNDRYANLETNYLLQRLESFIGICLLTSNHESNIDPAFMRRLSLHVRFDVPDASEREALWRAMLPAAAPRDERLDLGTLARKFAMSGGYIRNAALRAAFMAADEGSAITCAHLEHAARCEYEAMGKIAA